MPDYRANLQPVERRPVLEPHLDKVKYAPIGKFRGVNSEQLFHRRVFPDCSGFWEHHLRIRGSADHLDENIGIRVVVLG